MKRCSGCKLHKTHQEFSKDKSRWDALQPYCRECRKLLYGDWYEKNKSRAIKNAKEYAHKRKQSLVNRKGGKCQVCGYSKCNRALTFHHLYPDKKLSTEKRPFGRMSLENIENEIDEVVLVCHNCHMELEDGLINLGVE